MLNIYQLEQHITERMNIAHIPGLAIAIVKGQEVVYTRGFGVTSVEDGGLSVTPQTIFYIASTAKPLTGTALLHLVEAGKLDLDKPIKEYVDGLAFREAGMAERITLRMLMSHTSGLPTSSAYYGSHDTDGIERHVREKIPTYEFVAPPGKLYFYSNDGMVLAGYMAELVSGQPFAQLMQQAVFDPLEMQRTTYDPTVAMTYPLAQEHELHADGSLSVLHRYAYNTAYQPSSFLFSTVLDLANFAILHLNGGRFRGKQLLSPELVATMHTPQVSFNTVRDEGYGLTFRMYGYKGKRAIVHNGLFQATTTMFSLIPSDSVAVIMLFNGFYAGSGADAIVHSIYDQLLNLPSGTDIPAIQEIAPDTSRWSRYIGSYLNVLGGFATVYTANNRLMLDWNSRTSTLKAYAQDRYFAQDTPNSPILSVCFLPEESGPTQYMTVNGRGHCRIERDTSFIPDRSTWKEYAGTYVGDTGTVEVQIKGEQLMLYSKEDKMEVEGIPFEKDSFVGGFGLVEFLHDEEGKVRTLRRGKMFAHDLLV
jgi:CubicO group peptidase (beta-lactamase class C family)